MEPILGKSIILTLPYPKFTSNNYWIGKGKRLGYALNPAVKRFKAELRLIWLMEKKPVLNGKILMRVNMFPPDKRKRDVDGFIKGLMDSLQNSGFFKDDNQIDELHIIRREVQPPGCLQVMLQEIGA